MTGLDTKDDISRIPSGSPQDIKIVPKGFSFKTGEDIYRLFDSFWHSSNIASLSAQHNISGIPDGKFERS